MDAILKSDLQVKDVATETKSAVFWRPTAQTGLISWLTTVDHKKIGFLYGIFALFFFLVGGFEALLIRLQLMTPNGTVLTAQQYNTMFTMHGTTMIFLAVMPLSAAFLTLSCRSRLAPATWLSPPQRLLALDFCSRSHHSEPRLVYVGGCS